MADASQPQPQNLSLVAGANRILQPTSVRTRFPSIARVGVGPDLCDHAVCSSSPEKLTFRVEYEVPMSGCERTGGMDQCERLSAVRE